MHANDDPTHRGHGNSPPEQLGATIFSGARRPLTQIFNLYPGRRAPFQTGLLRNPKQRIRLAADHQM
jgi:hypothetical protein